ncbi:diaminopimelate epimerase [Alkaliphilus pronyensis]|uniref:Diaminopimelate epimerase n=1 Tax=Alkaliphilus pronyensis TaxID=1482732 RepID=A0A6I0FG73_9FIRM|nr:diaminopimelate epimerase [Alkaliphilus pronyensis]KAB3535241.1 diaminopimelate epimerase [Alkaliphilus pronyensis]
MKIPFKKMHGTGNDFIVINYNDFPYPKDFSRLAIEACHRNFGIGGDGMMIVASPEDKNASVKMIYFNRDGSLASMCGNGIRCFAKYVYDEKIVKKEIFKIQTKAGLLTVNTKTADGKVSFVKVYMGKMLLKPEAIPVAYNGDNYINKKIVVEGREFQISSVLMGVPHTIIFTEELNDEAVKHFGPIIEGLEIFPEKTNVNFAKIHNRAAISVKTWERGAGYTLACGTGVTSVCGVAYLLGMVDNWIEVTIDGGKLFISISNDGNMEMEGPAETICEGIYYLKN